MVNFMRGNSRTTIRFHSLQCNRACPFRCLKGIRTIVVFPVEGIASLHGKCTKLCNGSERKTNNPE